MSCAIARANYQGRIDIMHPDALAQASMKFQKARFVVEAMKADTSSPAVEFNWEEFLTAAHGIYSKLEQGAKTAPASKVWFNQKKHERRTDPLLTYIHQARNAEEHGIERITARTNSHVSVPPGGMVQFIPQETGGWKVGETIGEIGYPNDIVALVRVHDRRFGNWFDPPTTHLGQEFHDRSALAVAERAIVYLEGILAEAAALPAVG